jgi:hypothetical protein
MNLSERTKDEITVITGGIHGPGNHPAPSPAGAGMGTALTHHFPKAADHSRP